MAGLHKLTELETKRLKRFEKEIKYGHDDTVIKNLLTRIGTMSVDRKLALANLFLYINQPLYDKMQGCDSAGAVKEVIERTAPPLDRDEVMVDGEGVRDGADVERTGQEISGVVQPGTDDEEGGGEVWPDVRSVSQ